MSEIGEKFSLAADNFMTKTHLRQPGLHTVLVDHLQKTNKEQKSLKKQTIQEKFIKTNQVKLASDKILCDKAFTLAKN